MTKRGRPAKRKAADQITQCCTRLRSRKRIRSEDENLSSECVSSSPAEYSTMSNLPEDMTQEIGFGCEFQESDLDGLDLTVVDDLIDVPIVDFFPQWIDEIQKVEADSIVDEAKSNLELMQGIIGQDLLRLQNAGTIELRDQSMTLMSNHVDADSRVDGRTADESQLLRIMNELPEIGIDNQYTFVFDDDDSMQLAEWVSSYVELEPGATEEELLTIVGDPKVVCGVKSTELIVSNASINSATNATVGDGTTNSKEVTSVFNEPDNSDEDEFIDVGTESFVQPFIDLSPKAAKKVAIVSNERVRNNLGPKNLQLPKLNDSKNQNFASKRQLIVRTSMNTEATKSNFQTQLNNSGNDIAPPVRDSNNTPTVIKVQPIVRSANTQTAAEKVVANLQLQSSTGPKNQSGPTQVSALNTSTIDFKMQTIVRTTGNPVQNVNHNVPIKCVNLVQPSVSPANSLGHRTMVIQTSNNSNNKPSVDTRAQSIVRPTTSSIQKPFIMNCHSKVQKTSACATNNDIIVRTAPVQITKGNIAIVQPNIFPINNAGQRNVLFPASNYLNNNIPSTSAQLTLGREAVHSVPKVQPKTYSANSGGRKNVQVITLDDTETSHQANVKPQTVICNGSKPHEQTLKKLQIFPTQVQTKASDSRVSPVKNVGISISNSSIGNRATIKEEPFVHPAQKQVAKTTLANPTTNRAKTLQSKKPGSRNPLVNNAKIETLDDSDDSNDDFVDVASEPAVRNVAQPHGIMNNPTIKVEPAGYNIDNLTLSNVKKETRDDFSNVFFDFDTKTLVSQNSKPLDCKPQFVPNKTLLPGKVEMKTERALINIEKMEESSESESDDSDDDDFVDVDQKKIKLEETKDETDSDSDDSDTGDFVTIPDAGPFQRGPVKKPESLQKQIGVIHKIIQCLKDSYMKGVYSLPYDEVIQITKLEEFGNTLFETIRMKANDKDSKIGVTEDGELHYKPKYDIRNAEGLLEALSPMSGEIEGILFKDIEESLPNAKKVLEELEKSGRVRCLRGRESKKVVFCVMPNFEPNRYCELDESIRVYLRKADGEEKAAVMKHAAVLGLAKVKPKTSSLNFTRRRRKFLNYTSNQHLQNDLDIYNLNEISRPNPQPDEPRSSSSPSEPDLIPLEGRQLIWLFASQVMSFEETLVLYSLSCSQGMTKDDLFEKLSLKRVDIDRVLERLKELMLVRLQDHDEKGIFYYVNIKVFVEWVNYRLASAHKRVLKDEKEAQVIRYRCSGCRKEYVEFDVGNLMRAAVGRDGKELVCLQSYCNYEVIELEQSEKGALTLQFNTETAHLSELCRKCVELLGINL